MKIDTLFSLQKKDILKGYRAEKIVVLKKF